MPDASPVPIAFCITELEVGGAERMLVELATRIDRARFRPAVYALGPRPQGADAELVLRLEAAEVPVTFLEGRSAFGAPRVLRRLTKLLKEQRPAILQTFLWHANTLGAIAGGRAGVPHIVAGVRVAERRALVYRLVERWAARNIQHYICVSQAVAEHYQRQHSVSQDRITVIPNGIDADAYPAQTPADLASLGISPGRRALLYVGRLDEQKNVGWLLEQMPSVLLALANHDLLLVGRGPFEAKLREQAARLGLAERIHFAGWRSDVPEILAACDLLLLTSRYEGMPNVLLEAMASGKPVVATDAEGCAELLGAGGEQVVARGATKEFVERVVDIVGSESQARQLGAQNRARVARYFRIEQMVAAYEALYQTLPGRR